MTILLKKIYRFSEIMSINTECITTAPASIYLWLTIPCTHSFLINCICLAYYRIYGTGEIRAQHGLFLRTMQWIMLIRNILLFLPSTADVLGYLPPCIKVISLHLWKGERTTRYRALSLLYNYSNFIVRGAGGLSVILSW